MSRQIDPEVVKRLQLYHDTFSPMWSNLNEGGPDVVYHYTSYAGMVGILRSNEIYASNYRFLNDATENRFARRRAVKFIGDIKADAGVSGLFKLAVMYAIKREWDEDEPPTPEQRKRQKEMEDQFEQLYVASFCTAPDLLSMWRGYGSHLSGRFSIGLRVGPPVGVARTPDEALPVFHGSWRMGRVAYSTKDQREKLIARLRDFLPKVTGLDQALLDQFRTEALGGLEHVLPFIKHRAFSEEREWRAVRMAPANWTEISDDKHPDATCVGPTGRLFMKYRPHTLQEPTLLPITSICLGPTPDRLVVAKRLEALLRKERRTDISIGFSKIPLRDW